MNLRDTNTSILKFDLLPKIHNHFISVYSVMMNLSLFQFSAGFSIKIRLDHLSRWWWWEDGIVN